MRTIITIICLALVFHTQAGLIKMHDLKIRPAVAMTTGAGKVVIKPLR